METQLPATPVFPRLRIAAFFTFALTLLAGATPLLADPPPWAGKGRDNPEQRERKERDHAVENPTENGVPHGHLPPPEERQGAGKRGRERGREMKERDKDGEREIESRSEYREERGEILQEIDEHQRKIEELRAELAHLDRRWERAQGDVGSIDEETEIGSSPATGEAPPPRVKPEPAEDWRKAKWL